MYRLGHINLKIVSLLILVCSNLSNSQITSKNERAFFVLKSVYETKYQKKDSIGVMIKGKDTLVQIKTKKPWPSRSEINNQSLTGSSNSTYFVPKNVFKSNYKKSDSIGYMISKADTLIMVKELFTPSGIRVKYEPRDSTFLELYKEIAFKYKHKDCTDTQTMKYWKSPIKVYFDKNVHRTVVKKMAKFITQIDKNVDSLSIKRVRQLEQSNYVIFNDQSYQYDTRINKKVAADYYIEWNGKSQITKGALRYNLEKLPSIKLQLQKIKEMFIGSLGWFVSNDSLSCENYFSNCYSDRKRITRLDWELLRYHYSYGICKGTTLNVFEEQHRTAKKAMKENNGINNFYFIH